MNLISFCSQIIFGIVLTSVTGSCMFIVWLLFRILFEKRNPKFVYYMLRWVIIMYLLPIAYIGFVMYYDTGYVKPMHGLIKMLFVVDLNDLLYQGLVCIWIVMTGIMIGFSIKNGIGKWRICKCNFEDGDSLAQREFERIKTQLGIKDNVVLLRNDHPDLYSPFVSGLLRPKVVIPYRDYSQSELDAILYHELNHVKKHDVAFRYLTMLAIIVNSINPFAFALWNQMLMWSEAACDARTLDVLEKENVSKRHYYDIIWHLMTEGPQEPTFMYHPMLTNTQNTLYRRMKIMERYRANKRKTAKAVAIAWVMVVASLSTVTAHAAGTGLAKYADGALQESQVILQNESVDVYNWSDEMLVESDEDIDIIYMNDGLMTLGEGSISWDVPIGTRCVTASIYMKEGTKVQIACTATPDDCTYWFGLMYASSTCSVVEGEGQGSHAFTVPSNGYYRIMVENRSSEAMHVVGSYQY